MAYDNDTINSLGELGLSREATPAIKEIYYKLLLLYSERNDTLEIINRELREMISVRDIMKQQLIKQFKPAKDDMGGPTFAEYWDPEFLCYTIKAHVDEASSNELAGREIVVRISNRSSNNNFGMHDIRRMLESKYDAAKAANPKNAAYLATIQKIRDEFEEQIEKTIGDDLADTMKNNISLQRKFIAKMATELAKSQSKSISKKSVFEQVRNLKKLEIDIISKQKRPVVINLYPLETNDAEKSTWVYNTNIPRSDISSAQRTFQTRELSNFWEIHNRPVSIQHDPEHSITIGKEESFYRSGSIAMLEEYIDEDKDEDELDTAEQDPEILLASQSNRNLLREKKPKLSMQEIERIEYEALLKYVKQIAIRQIVTKINEGEIVGNPLKLNLAFNTLLSPIVGKPHEFFARFTPAVLGQGNERSQLESMRKLFDKIDAEKIGLNPDDIKLISQQIGQDKLTPTVKKSLYPQRIQINTVYLNLPVNKVGKIHMEHFERVTFNRFNHDYNEAGMQKYRSKIVNFLDTTCTPMELLVVKQLFVRPYTTDTWSARKEMLEKASKSLKNEQLSLLINTFINIQDYLYKDDKQVADNTRIANGYLIASVSIATLNNILDFETHATCKSGKDRTGLYSGFREALLAKGSEDLLIKNLCNVLKYSALKDLNEYNSPGCRGLQVDNDILDGLEYYFGTELAGDHSEITELIKINQLRKVGAMGKKIWMCSNEINALLDQEPKISYGVRLMETIQAGINTLTTPSTSPEQQKTILPTATLPTKEKQLVKFSETTQPASSASAAAITNALKGLKHVSTAASQAEVPPEENNDDSRRRTVAEIRAKFEKQSGKTTPSNKG